MQLRDWTGHFIENGLKTYCSQYNCNYLLNNYMNIMLRKHIKKLHALAYDSYIVEYLK